MRYVRLERRENTGHVAAREVRRHDPFFVWGRGCEAGCGSWWERFEAGWLEAVCGSRQAAAGQRSTRSALRSRRQERLGCEDGGGVVPPNRLRAALAVRCPSAADGVRGGSVRGGLWFEADSRWGVRRAGVRGCLWLEVGSRRAAVDSLRAALSSARKVEDARMGLVVPPNRLRAALAARCPSVADGVRDGSGSRRDGSRRERFEAVGGSRRAAAGQRSTRSAPRSRRQERLGCEDGARRASE